MSGTSTLQVTYEFAGFRLEPARRALLLPDGTPARLSGKPFDTLVYLVERAGQLVDRDELLGAVWPKRVIEDNNLNQAIAALRRVLGEQHVATVAGRGYQFVTPVSVVPLSGAPAAAEPPMEIALPAAPPASSQPAAARPRLFGWSAAVAFIAGAAAMVLLALTPPTSEPTTLAGASIRAQPLTTYPGEETSPALSPDGTRVAFSWQGPSGSSRDLYVTQVGVTTPIRLTDAGGADDVAPAWSPDGERIAFVRRYDPERFDVMVMPALGGQALPKYRGRMYSTSVDGYPLLAWTPDGRQLLFTTERTPSTPDAGFGLHRLTVDSGEVEDLGLTTDSMHYDTSPAVSPDGRWLAFTRYRRTQRLNQVLLQRLERGFVPVGEPQPVPNLEEDIHHSLHWAADSSRLWFAAGGQITEWALDGAPRAIHSTGPRFATSSLSIVSRAGGARAAIVAVRTDTDLFAVPVDPVTHIATGEAVVRAASTAVDYHPRISPDGKTLAFISNRSGAPDVWLANPDGTNARQLTRVGQLVVGFPRWSPDSQFIAFHSSAPGEPRVIHRVEVATGITNRLFNGCCPGGWSADGRSLYVTELGDINYIARVDVDSGDRERLVEGETGTESLDGQYLLFSRSREPGFFRWPLHEASGQAEAERLVADYTTGNGANGGIAPTADGFYYVALTDDSTPRAIRFYDYASGEAKDVAPVPARTTIGLTVTSAGEVLYAAVGRPEADLQLLDLTAAGP